MKPASQAKLAKRIHSDAQRFAALKDELTALGYFCKGTLLKRMMKCGKKGCVCQRDPAKRHGPYFECTFKRDNKTINVRLPAQAAPLYRNAIQQYHRLRRLLDRLEQHSRSALAHLAEFKSADRN
ncbi:MAG: hypothetical protein IT165_23165 [Bryobacterales bacterium]|nr:hypothetical protein [Bryobacterales bacterium]